MQLISLSLSVFFLASSVLGQAISRERLDSVNVPHFSDSTAANDWYSCGQLDDDEALTVHVSLAARESCTSDKLSDELMAVSDPKSPRYGKFWNVDDIANVCGHALVAPVKKENVASDDSASEFKSSSTMKLSSSNPAVSMFATARHVEIWAESHGLDFELTSLQSDWAVIRGPAKKINNLLGGKLEFHKFVPKMFKESIRSCDLNDPRVIVRSVKSEYTVPKRLAKHVTLIAGIFRFPKLPDVLRNEANIIKTSETGGSFIASALSALKSSPVDVTPSWIWNRYNIKPNVRSSNDTGASQAVVSFLGQYFDPADLDTYLNKYGLPGHVNGASEVIGPNDPSNPGVEATLDVDFLMGVGNGIKTLVWSTGGKSKVTGQEPFIVFLNDVWKKSSSQPIPLVFSISYQDYEYTVTPAYADAIDRDFVKLGLLGTTVVTGSGDWGVGGSCTASGQCEGFSADFPSSSPHIVSSGAVQANVDGSEESASFSSGGFSYIFPRPSFQNDAINAFFSSSNPGPMPSSTFFNASGRGFPDVAAVGVNFQVLYKGKIIPVAGTSASTPTIAAMISLINRDLLAAGKSPVGWPLPAFYQNADVFTPTTQGCNPNKCCTGFCTWNGWSPVTGLGSMDWTAMRDRFMAAKQ